MMRGSGSTALQRMLGNYVQTKQNTMPELARTPLSGIGKWNKQGEDNLRSGLTDAMTGNLEMSAGAKLGTDTFGQNTVNPWEAFLATPASQMSMDDDEGDFMSAYNPQARGINLSFW